MKEICGSIIYTHHSLVKILKEVIYKPSVEGDLRNSMRIVSFFTANRFVLTLQSPLFIGSAAQMKNNLTAVNDIFMKQIISF